MSPSTQGGNCNLDLKKIIYFIGPCSDLSDEQANICREVKENGLSFGGEEPLSEALRCLSKSKVNVDFKDILSTLSSKCHCNNQNNSNCIKDIINEIIKEAIQKGLVYKSSNQPCNSNCSNCLVGGGTSSATSIKKIVCNDSDCNNSLCKKAFVSLLVSLKATLREIETDMGRSGRCSDSCRNCKLDSWVYWFFDTCYDKERAKKLYEALEELRSKFTNSGLDFCKFLALLVAAYTAAIEEPSELWRIDWFISLVYAASGKVLPLCPSKGDVAALVYYAYLICCGSSCSSGCTISNDELQQFIGILVNMSPGTSSTSGTSS